MGAPRPPELALREPCAEPPARSETHSQPGEAHLTLPEHSTSDFKPGTLRADAPPHLGVPLAPDGLHPVCAHVPHRKPGTCPVPVSFPPTPQDLRVGVGPTSQEGGAAEPWVTQCPGHTTAACLPVAETLLCAMEATVRSCWTRPACHVTEVASCV